jgi:serine/threonine protein kinase
MLVASVNLKPGTSLGRYEILAPIAAGGMGEVYRARDAKLERAVAIKIIPEAVARDPRLRLRLEKEARAISALVHPNICTLHDLDHHDGVDFLVMEYCEGKTLRERMARVRFSDEASG